MNERFRQLAEQAGFSEDKYGLYWDEDANAEGVDLKKFAELIVQECAGVCENSNYEFGTIFTKMIKEHFGVEE